MSTNSISILSPGRINLIGEHIDYNGGVVLPASISKQIKIDFTVTDTDTFSVYSKDLNEHFESAIDISEPSAVQWHNYILGVVKELNDRRPGQIKGFSCEISSSIPLGSGVSSSAALECGIAKGLNILFDLNIPDQELILLSRDAEHRFVGTQCGVMDQFAVVMGKAEHFILLNSGTLDYELISADLDDYQLVLLNTNVSHNLASSAYNKRRRQCEESLSIIKEGYPKYQHLAQVPETLISEFRDQLGPERFQRAMFVTQENDRVHNAVDALRNKDFNLLGKLLYASHNGLSTMYEVSCKELDFLVDKFKDDDKVLGSRMMGGGFGGCTLNLVGRNYVSTFIEKASKAYINEFNRSLTPIDFEIADGVNLL